MSANMTDVSDVPIFDDGDEEEVDSKTRRIRLKKEWYVFCIPTSSKLWF
jgi:hypothetical protein